MSFILDALRKSDTERQEQSGPALATAQQRTRTKTRSLWMPLLVGVLLLNAVVMGWVLLNDSEPPKMTPVTAAAPDPVAAPGPSLRPSPGETASRSLREEALSTMPAPAPQAAETAKRGAAPTAKPVTTTPARPKPEPSAAAADRIEEDAARLPSFQQLVVAGVLSIPTLHLDIHVYAGNSEKRFVFINSRKYRERDRLSEGPVVETITQTGVVLTHQGNRFTLERE